MKTNGHPCSESHKQKLREFMTGRPKSVEACNKMGLTKIGNKNMLGKLQSEETKQKNRDFHIGKKASKETREKMSKFRKGKATRPAGWKHTEKARRKIKASYRGWNDGEKSHLWKGGISALSKLTRSCFKYRQWRSDVFTRDDFTCVFCGKKGCFIEADHYPKTFAEIFHENEIKSLKQAIDCEEFWNINNGRTLCRKCHDTTKWGRNMVRIPDEIA